MSFDDLFAEYQAGGAVGIDSGTYTVLVTAARPYAKSRLLYLTLAVQQGPLTGKETEVNLYLPKDGDKPFARTMFVRKLAGFNLGKATFDAMSAAGDDIDAVLNVLAEAVVNRTISAEIVLRGEDAGAYAGTNEMTSSKPVDGAPSAAPAAIPVAQPVAAPAPAAATAAPASANVAAPDPGF